ncbi:centriole, cilia and spindle-associated protein isoform X2 [Melanotaenia boesemani]|uniref:centriole, cilia and spindle-associated protein isoform X2 n=1 Tax=Melanotaenia boesemani TaxID=1250792 RepID=UPI001C04F11F|nr:centriole, cilia and spindle-associated protein isoform X2 [Melanotaenia boesemani]
MVTKRIRSEYMKKFKDPKWETYTKCYEAMLKYRLTRRLLEHTHNPWFWNGSESDSESGGRSPALPSKNQVGAETTSDRAEVELEECEGARMDRLEQQARTTGPVPRLPIQDKEEEENVSAVQSLVHENDKRKPRSQQKKPSKTTKQTWRSQRVKPSPLWQPREDSKGSRHPFALYGSGEKDADIAGRKTHNVGPAASTNEIHESALRAKTRREVERQIQTQRTERRRAKSADLDKVRKQVQPEFNPWLTEYMRCFSARSR